MNQNWLREEYSFETFLDGIKNLSRADMIVRAASKAEQMEKFLYGSMAKGSKQARDAGAGELPKRLGPFLWFLRNMQKPAFISDSEFSLYFPVAKTLVKRGEMGPEVLNLFPKRVEPSQ